MPAAVLFDLDDTLIDETTASRDAVLAWAAELELTGPGADQRWARISARHYSRYQRRELSFAQQRRERVRDFLGTALTDTAADRLFATYLRHYEAAWTVFDDAVPTLRRARESGLRVAVLTNGEHSQQHHKLERLSLLSEIDLLVASSTLPAGKPDPGAFRHTVNHLGVEPVDVVMVGDSLEKDVFGARAAGLSAILLDRDGTRAGSGVPRVRSLNDLVFTPDRKMTPT
ncbi:haloacid dehalogenase [Actinoplanes sp. SE50]|uniref:HAD family hydrolase n=1 Tax=unclassified Actinoplanes TaxID=2626549 RepID=UPI00023EC607|nr:MULTISPECIES: HAD family hydrolase [unclassified Actinoplanes]AEV84184.1 putative hydrolase of the HAD superfamily [Actinoplanes sp. SE50/110]ATO82576.1 haloacid dehalogenase [Actinoplanes sp. SE50]SLL99983.1 haloacid dehalogenase [Actinoplanes sp. SE50/110]